MLNLLLERMKCIVDLVSKSWDEYFAHFASNHKAVAEWGWGSLNYNVCK